MTNGQRNPEMSDRGFAQLPATPSKYGFQNFSNCGTIRLAYCASSRRDFKFPGIVCEYEIDRKDSIHRRVHKARRIKQECLPELIGNLCHSRATELEVVQWVDLFRDMGSSVVVLIM